MPEIYEPGLEDYPSEEAAPQAQATQKINIRDVADELFDNWKLDNAMEMYQLLWKSKKERHVINRIARIHALRGRLSQMIKCCMEWQDQLEWQGNFALAKLVSDSICSLDPLNPQGKLSQLHHLARTASKEEYIAAARSAARFFVDIGCGEYSIETLNNAIELYPGNMVLSQDLADMHMAQGNIQESIKQFRELASLYESQGEPLKAVDSYRRLKLLIPDSNEFSLRLGDIYMQHENYEEAISEYRNVLRITIDNHDALIGLAKAFAKQGMKIEEELKAKELSGETEPEAGADAEEQDTSKPDTAGDEELNEDEELFGKEDDEQGDSEEQERQAAPKKPIADPSQYYRDAVLAYKKILATGVYDVTCHTELAELYVRQSMITDAVKELITAGMKYSADKQFAEAVKVYSRVLELDAANQVAVRERSNASDALAAEEVRKAKLREEMEKARAEKEARRAAEEKARAALEASRAAVSASASADGDLYDLDDGPQGSLDSLDGDGLYSESAPSARKSPAKGQEVRYETKVTRVRYEVGTAGKLHVPVPFVMATYPDIVPLVQAEINSPPEQSVIPWEMLKILDEHTRDEDDDVVAEVSAVVQVNRQAGPVKSAFGDSAGGFNFAAASSARTSRRRRGRWVFQPEEAPPRSAYGHDDNDPQRMLADRIRQKKEEEADSNHFNRLARDRR